MSDRLPDTGFQQWGASARANWAPAPSPQIVLQLPAAHARTAASGTTSCSAATAT